MGRCVATRVSELFEVLKVVKPRVTQSVTKPNHIGLTAHNHTSTHYC